MKPYKPEALVAVSRYEKNLMEDFPYIGGDDVSGTSNLTSVKVYTGSEISIICEISSGIFN